MRFGPRSRIVGVDDAPFGPKPGARVLLVGVLMSGPRVDGVMTTQVVRDGVRATGAIERMLSTGRLANQGQAVVLDGVAVGGFNVIDLPLLAESLSVPVVAVMRRRPNLEAIRMALSKTRHGEMRWRRMQRAGPIHEAGAMFFQIAGASPGLGRRILEHSSPDGGYPEALRLAHLIGGGVKLGVSRGGA
jgi:hypothetical protein